MISVCKIDTPEQVKATLESLIKFQPNQRGEVLKYVLKRLDEMKIGGLIDNPSFQDFSYTAKLKLAEIKRCQTQEKSQ